MNNIIDFHSHILPGIDDGSSSLEESIELLRIEWKQGIQHVIATPHFYANHDSPDRFLRRREEAEKMLRAEMECHAELPEISVGAEVYFFSGISESDALLELTIAEKKCILIEMPPPPWSDAMYRELEGIYEKQGIVPIIAHVDRYISPWKTYRIPERLAELPVVVQANADFFLQRATRRMAFRLLREDKIQLLGSDCHNMRSRQPNLGEMVNLIEKKLGQDVIGRIHAWQEELLTHETVSL